MRLDPVRGIVAQGTRFESPMFDRFATCQDGQLGFMVSEPNSTKPGKCIFSGVIIDVLYGIEPAAIQDGVITTATFGVCVRARAEQRAKDYHLKLNPQCSIDPQAVVLYDAKKPPQPQPVLQPWPPAGSAAVMGADFPAVAGAGDADRNLELVRSDEGFRKRILGPSFGLNRHDLADSSPVLRIPSESKRLLNHLVTLRMSSSPKTPRARIPGKRQKVEALVQRLEADAAADARKRAAVGVRRSLVEIGSLAGRDGCNLIVSDNGARLWSRDPVKERRPMAAHVAFHVESDPQGTPILVELADGSFTQLVPYQRLYAVVEQSTAGDVLQAYGRHDLRTAFMDAIETVTDFAAGRIGVDRIDFLAGRLRHGKYTDPVLGAICAYLYLAVADFDSIRRMAYFYVQYGQPVPFDIALLGAMKVTRKAKGALRLQVPAVTARKPGRGGPESACDLSARRHRRQRPGSAGDALGSGWAGIMSARRGLSGPRWLTASLIMPGRFVAAALPYCRTRSD